MQGLETSDHLANTLPNLPLRECTAPFLMLENPLIQIAPIRKFHDYAQSLRDFIIEGLLVPNHILMLYTGKDAHFIKCVLLLLICQLFHPHLFKCIFDIVAYPDDPVDLAEGTLTYLFDDLEIGET